jgi:hypothetical protein
VIRETSKAKFFALILTISPLSSVGNAVEPPAGVVGVPVIAVLSGVPMVMTGPEVWDITGVGTVVADVVVTGPEVWLVQPVTTNATLTRISSRIIMVRFSMQEPIIS